MTVRSQISRDRDDQGVALIMVLGFLSILIILSVTFAMTMRTERQAAGNFSSAAQARMLVPLATHLAMDKIESQRQNSGGLFAGAAVKDRMYPASDFAYTSGTGAGPDVAKIFSGAARDFVPRDLWGVGPTLNARTRWIEISDDVGNTRVGRYAFIAFDTSGYIDVHQVGTNGTRDVGYSFGEVDISKLPDINDQDAVTASVDQYVQFDSLKEISAIGTGTANDQSSLFHFNRFPAGVYTNSVIEDPLDISGVTWVTQGHLDADIKDGFMKLGFTDPQAVILRDGLKDYVDPDHVPQDLAVTPRANWVGGPSVENVPMFNEIAIKSTVTKIEQPDTMLDEWTYTLNSALSVELMFPGVSVFPDQYYFDVELKLTADIGGKKNAGNNIRFTGPAMGSADMQTTPGGRYWTATVTNNTGWVVEKVAQTPVVPQQAEFTVEVVFADVIKIGGSETVDNILSKAGAEPSFTYDGSALLDAGDSWSYECVDPRFNWDLTDSNHWVERGAVNQNSLGQINPVTQAKLDEAGTDGVDNNDVWTYCANGELLVPGELGYLPYEPWTTIRLFSDADRAGVPVDNAFRVGTSAGGYYYRPDGSTNAVDYGKVNLNSTKENVLASIFYNMPLDTHPGGNGSLVTWSEAQDLAAEINAGGPYVNPGDMVTIDDLPGVLPAGTMTNELVKESVHRNSSQLFGTRSNVITMIMLVQAAKDSNGSAGIQDDEVTASLKLAAVIWRDPFPDASGKREMYIRSLEFIYDD